MVNIDLNDLLSYSTVKIVKIRDWRLGFLHYLFMLGVLLYIFIYAVWWKQGYLSKEDPIGGVRVSLQQPSVLNGPTEYPYCQQNQAQYQGFNNLQCIYMAGDQAMYPSGLTGFPFITTRYKSTTRTAPSGCETPTSPECIMSSSTPNTTTIRSYIAGIEDFTLFIDHLVYGLTNDFVRRSLDMKGEVWKDGQKLQVLPDDRTGDIFTISQLLSFAGLDSLDVASGVTGSTGSLRYDGVQLIVVIEYFNRVSQPTELKYRYSVKQVPKVDTARFEPSASNQNANRHGVDILFIQTGLIGQFSFPALLSSIVGGLVLMGIATTVVDVLAIYILPQKKVYSDSKFQLTKDLASTPGQMFKKEAGSQSSGDGLAYRSSQRGTSLMYYLRI